jgi:hypothetical protein
MTCDHPECADDAPKTYTDEHGNTLALCEAHYYYLVSGKKPSTLRPERTVGFDPVRRKAVLAKTLERDKPTSRTGIDFPEPELHTKRREQ